MAIWLALLVAPLLALADQSAALSMTVWACRGQHGLALHLLHAAFAAGTAVITVLAWQRWRTTARDQPADESTARRHFLAGMAIGVSALSLAAIVAMWGPTWALSSC